MFCNDVPNDAGNNALHQFSVTTRICRPMSCKAPRATVGSLPRMAGFVATKFLMNTVYRNKRRFAEAGLEGVLQDRPQAQRYRKLDDRGEAHLIAPRSWQGAGYWPAAQRRRGMTTGPCACWRARWWSWGWRPPCPMRRCASGSKKRPQAVAEAGMVHPKGKRRLRGPHGGRAGPVRRTL